ncbi:MAG: CotH kinase family protein, partial [Oscillospiraceae bacterium]|nr:CotH kinase family protein [Oscillospiraceae bacterium]
MNTRKKIPYITAALMCVCLIICGFIVYAADTFDTTKVPIYQRKMFGDEVITLDILAEPDEWKAMLNKAQAKEWISADLVINGELFKAVGVRTKGNSSLMQTGGPGGSGGITNYSLQFKFNKYVKGQTYYGLDAFCVNNMMGDATYMKDYLAFDIMNYIGVATPLTNYANVTVNGDAYGFGVALERYDKAFLDRVYSTSAGQLYNVKIGMGMRGNFEDMWQNVHGETAARPQAGGDFGDGGGMGGGDMGGGGMGPGNTGGNGGGERDFGGGGGGMGRGGFGGDGGS